MRFIIRRYFSGYCSYEIDAVNENIAYEKAIELPINITKSLPLWKNGKNVTK